MFIKPLAKNLFFAATLGLAGSYIHAADAINLDIQSDLAGPALMKLAKAAHVQILVPEDIAESVTLPALSGEYSLQEALGTMLAGTGLSYQFTSERSVVVQAGSKAKAKAGDPGVKNEALEEILVTAQKREQSVKDVPISIMALGANELEERGIENFEDLGLAVPGLSVQDSGGLNRRVFIRGVANSAGSSSLVGIYIDEATVTGNQAFQLDVRPYDLERIEVLRGPQGTLYGEGSVGGTIRFISKKPELDRFGVKADVAASTTQSGELSQKIQSVINVPIVENTFGLRIASTVENAGGWIDQPSVGREDFNSQNVFNTHIKALWLPADELEVNAAVLIHRNDIASNGGEDENGNFTQVFDLPTVPSIEDDYELYNLTVNYDFGVVSLLSSSSYLDAQKTTKQLGSTFPILPPPFPAFHTLFVDFPLNTKVFSEELRLSSNGDGPWQWSLGGFYRDSDITQEGTLLFSFPGGPLPPALPFFLEETSKSWAAFGDTSIVIADWIETGVGLRYYRDDREASNGGPFASKSFDSVSPRFYINMDVAEDVKVYTSAAKGFRSGGFDLTGGGTYEPDSVWTYELGTKMTLLGGRLDGELAVFYSEYKDYQIVGTPPPPEPPLQIISNAGDVEVQGVDWAFTWNVTDNLSLAFNGNYVSSEFVEINLISAPYAVGDSLDLIPRYQATVSAVYDFEMASRPAFFRVDYNQKGRSLSQDRSIGPHFTGESDIINMLNLRAQWQFNDNLSIGLFAANLLNERGFIDPFIVSQSAARPRPRTIGFTLGMDF